MDICIEASRVRIEIGIKARHLELICSGGERRMKLDDQKRIIGGSLVRVP